MLKHLFKLIWNKKKQNFLLLSEIFVSFLVIFIVFSFLCFHYQNYNTPLGFDYKQVWSISYDNSQQTKNPDSLNIFYTNLYKSLKAMPQIEEVTYTSPNFPYSNSGINTTFTRNGKKFDNTNYYTIGNDYLKVWKISLSSGRWFKPEDAVSNEKIIVINEALQKAVFGKESAIGEVLQDYQQKVKVIGVIKDIKSDGDYSPAEKAMYQLIDTTSLKNTSDILIKVSTDADAKFESQLYKFMTNTIKDANIKIEHVSEMRDSKNKTTIIPVIIFTIVAGFLIINVALGLFGILWYNINKRRGEIGLRMAIGASGKAISYQLVAEALILATFSLMVGSLFAIQFPLLGVFHLPSSVYIIAMLLAVVFIYLLVFACALYPGRQAAGIHPAIALHEE